MRRRKIVIEHDPSSIPDDQEFLALSDDFKLCEWWREQPATMQLRELCAPDGIRSVYVYDRTGEPTAGAFGVVLGADRENVPKLPDVGIVWGRSHDEPLAGRVSVQPVNLEDPVRVLKHSSATLLTYRSLSTDAQLMLVSIADSGAPPQKAEELWSARIDLLERLSSMIQQVRRRPRSDMPSILESERAFERDFESLRSEYPNHWVAYCDGRRLGIDADHDRLLASREVAQCDFDSVYIRCLDTSASTSLPFAT